MTGSVESSSRTRQRLNLIRQTVTLLNELLTMLYPESPSADVITLNDFLVRYRLTELGAPAVQAIEQTQRINRTLNNYRQMGLSEFHIGLFYLHWGECQGGIKQFKHAQQQWSFVDAAASICLAHFAEGRAHHLAFEYEVAMHHYSKAAQWLARIQFSPPSNNQDEFVGQMTDYLQEWQARLRDDMLPDFRAEEPIAAAGAEEQPTRANGMATEEPEETITPLREDTPVTPQQVAPLPYFNIDAEPDWTKTPIPAHRNLDEKFAWYRVDETDEHFLPEVVEGTWVLVDKETNEHEFKQDELIVVVPTGATDGGIVLGPRAPEQLFPRIYLASSQFQGRFVRDVTTGKVALSSQLRAISVSHKEVVGYVVGLWLNKAPV